MAPLRGWGPVRGFAPQGRWHTLTFARYAATGSPRPASSSTCADFKPGDIVIMDNLGSHKAVRNAIRAAGARLWLLPKYSPDLNPIERPLPKSSTG